MCNIKRNPGRRTKTIGVWFFFFFGDKTDIWSEMSIALSLPKKEKEKKKRANSKDLTKKDFAVMGEVAFL